MTMKEIITNKEFLETVKNIEPNKYEVIPVIEQYVHNCDELIKLHNLAVSKKRRANLIYETKSEFNVIAKELNLTPYKILNLKTIKSEQEYFMIENDVITGYYKWQVYDKIDYVAIVEMIKNIK